MNDGALPGHGETAGSASLPTDDQMAEFRVMQGDPLTVADRARVLMDHLITGKYAQQDRFRDIAAKLLSLGLRPRAREILEQAWNALGELQRATGRKHDRGVIAGNLSLITEDRGTRLRWMVLAHFDDMLKNHKTGMARQALAEMFGLTLSQIAQLDELAELCAKECSGKWNAREGFAEFALIRATTTQLLAGSVTASTAESEFPLSPPFFAALADHINADGLSKQLKGDALEELAAYVALLIPGCTVAHKVLDLDDVGESDLLVANRAATHTLYSELFGRHFIIECKNWDALDVGVKEIGYFIVRVQLTHCRFGIMFSKNGITGNAEQQSAARGLIRRAYHESGILCVVVEAADFDRLKSGELSPSALLIRKVEEFRFGQPRHAKRADDGEHTK